MYDRFRPSSVVKSVTLWLFPGSCALGSGLSHPGEWDLDPAALARPERRTALPRRVVWRRMLQTESMEYTLYMQRIPVLLLQLRLLSIQNRRIGSGKADWRVRDRRISHARRVAASGNWSTFRNTIAHHGWTSSAQGCEVGLKEVDCRLSPGHLEWLLAHSPVLLSAGQQHQGIHEPDGEDPQSRHCTEV